MNTLIWRLHRQQAYFAAAGLIVVTVVLVITGTRMTDEFHSAIAACTPVHTCGSLRLFDGDGAILDLVLATAGIPLLFGLFWGAPLVAKDLEEGTQNFAWTQTVTRRKWFLSTAAAVVVVAAAWAAVLGSLLTWWETPESFLNGTRFDFAFDLSGIAPVAYAIFAVALGMAAGSILKRVLPALAVTLTGFIGIRGAIEMWVRPHYLAPISETVAFKNAEAPPGAWVIKTSLVNRAGHIVPQHLRGACTSTRCLDSLYKLIITYQPASRYWTFQGIESGIFVLLALVLLAIAYWRVLRVEP